ncbi:MAG: hypothetical protein AB7P11_15365 [Hydrogenophaga sp.]|uniref:hypothetical protein n=1 Tax=Hydrogenophaga sp. TaxID=1904254 RepID=UPI003D0CED49
MSQSTVKVGSSALKKSMVLYAVVCTGIVAVATGVAIFSPKVQLGFFGYIALFVSGSIFTTIGALAGDALRRLAMPDLYVTRGFTDSIKKRIFWAIGPQAIGWFLGTIATNGFMQNYLDYDMQAGTGGSTAARIEATPSASAPSTQSTVSMVASEPQTPPKAAPQPFPIIEVGACVMGVHRQTPQGLEFVRSIPVYPQGGSVEAIDSMKEFSAFYAEQQHSVTGRVQLVYAPGVFEDEPKAGQTLGWVDAQDLEVYEQRNCQ